MKLSRPLALLLATAELMFVTAQGTCPQIACVMFCPNGQQKDENGCDKCSCAHAGSQVADIEDSCGRDAKGCCSNLGSAWCPDQNICISTLPGAVLTCESWGNNPPVTKATAGGSTDDGYDGGDAQGSSQPANFASAQTVAFPSSQPPLAPAAAGNFAFASQTTPNFAPAQTLTSSFTPYQSQAFFSLPPQAAPLSYVPRTTYPPVQTFGQFTGFSSQASVGSYPVVQQQPYFPSYNAPLAFQGGVFGGATNMGYRGW